MKTTQARSLASVTKEYGWNLGCAIQGLFSSFNDLNTNNTRILLHQTCILLYFMHASPVFSILGGPPLFSQLHMTTGFMSMYILGAPHRAAAASVAAELGMSAPDPREFASQHAFSSSVIHRALPAVAEALLVLGHAESSLEMTGELVRTRTSCPALALVWPCASTCALLVRCRVDSQETRGAAFVGSKARSLLTPAHCAPRVPRSKRRSSRV